MQFELILRRSCLDSLTRQFSLNVWKMGRLFSPSCLLGSAEPRYVYQLVRWVVPLNEEIIDSCNRKVEPLIAETNLRLGSQRKSIYIRSQSNFTRGTKRTLQSLIVYTLIVTVWPARSGLANPDRAGRERAVSVWNLNCRLLDSSMC